MGKQSRRKRNRKNQKNGPPNNDSNTASSSTLWKRLAHVDARVRHDALSALATTLLSPYELEHRKNTISPVLLQAIVERVVLDEDLECTQAAAGCLANYVSYHNTNNNNNDEMTAGWTLVLMGRLNKSHEAFNDVIGNAASHKQKEWAVTVQCLHALCALVERNPKALERIMNHNDNSKAMEFVHLMISFLVSSQEELAALQQQNQNKKASASHNATATAQQDEEEQTTMTEWIQDVAVYAVRSLHSALDDNTDLLWAWMQEHNGVTIRQGLEVLVEACRRRHTVTPARCLHAAGCLVSIRQMLLLILATTQQHDEKELSLLLLHAVQESVQTVVVPLLKSHLDYNKETAQELIANILKTRDAYTKEQADSALEKQVMDQVNQRKEPARLIARRQKQNKQEKQKATIAANDTAMTDQQADPMDDDKKAMDQDPMQEEEEKEEASKNDCRDDMDKARQAWHSALLPMHLTLEISANLIGSFVQENDNHDDDEDNVVDMEEEDWGPTQEAQLLAQQGSATNDRQQQDQQERMHPLDEALANLLIQDGFADCLVVLLKNLCTFPLQPSGNDGTVPPPYVMQELADLISKCSGCIGNCLCNLSTLWRVSDPISVWKEFVQCLQALLSSSPFLVSMEEVTEGISSSMVVALRSRPLLRSQIQQDDLDFLVSLLVVESSSTSSPHPAVLQRDAACMLGILCSSESHSTQVNTKVSSSLLTALSSSSSAMVQSEAFNALMDIYGEDDVHADVFVSLDVLGNFQRTLPHFKKRIRGALPEDAEPWKETALNVSRFIQYKKGQL